MRQSIILYTLMLSLSFFHRSSSCKDHHLPCSPSGGSILKAGVSVQRQPLVRYSNSIFVSVSLLYNASDRYMYCESSLSNILWPHRPDPVIWTKDGGELPDLDRMIVDGRELTFTVLNKTDNGTYRCEASNHLGTSVDEYVLYVYGKFRGKAALGVIISPVITHKGTESFNT